MKGKLEMDKAGGRGGGEMSDSGSGGVSSLIRRQTAVSAAALFVGVAFFSCLILFHVTYPFQQFFVPSSFHFIDDDADTSQGIHNIKLENVLRNASMEDGTVILTTLNDAWAEPNSLVHVFLESFKMGDNTQRLLNHLVVISMDEKAQNRCLALHPHCYALVGASNFTHEAYFMTPVYLQMMWRRIQLLGTVLQMGYNFVFTDADVMWLRDPFPHFYPHTDFQIACDHYFGDSFSKSNEPNGGFNYVRSNNRTIDFYKFWYVSRKTYPGKHDQDVLNRIKSHPFVIKSGLTMRFLDTAYFGGFCQPSKDFNKVCTMHANCCFGLEHKLHDLRLVLQDWRRYMSWRSNSSIQVSSSPPSWRAPQKCP